MKNEDLRKQMLLDHLDSVFYGKAWHGASLLGTVRKIDVEHALKQNAEGFSAWKIILHCAYWKYDIRRTLAVEGGVSPFSRKPRDFPRLPDHPDEKAWAADKRFLEEEHRLLREAVERFPATRLDEVPLKRRFTYAGYVLGAASHDVYHTAHIRNLGVMEF